jgi:hypothetical protein
MFLITNILSEAKQIQIIITCFFIELQRIYDCTWQNTESTSVIELRDNTELKVHTSTCYLLKNLDYTILKWRTSKYLFTWSVLSSKNLYIEIFEICLQKNETASALIVISYSISSAVTSTTTWKINRGAVYHLSLQFLLRTKWEILFRPLKKKNQRFIQSEEHLQRKFKAL